MNHRRQIVLSFFFAIVSLGLFAIADNAKAVTPCNSPADCPANDLCTRGVCLAIQYDCKDNSECGPLGYCTLVGNIKSCRQVQCKEDVHCDQPAFCENNMCRQVECREDKDCRGDHACGDANTCEARCEGGSYVKSNTQPQCTACIPDTTPRVRSPAECPLNLIYAEGYCIKKCSGPDINMRKPGKVVPVDPDLLNPNTTPGKVPVTPPGPQPDPPPYSSNPSRR